MISTNSLVIIALIIAGFLFNYWEIKKNTTLLSVVVTHLKELRVTTYPRKHINNEINIEEKNIINSNKINKKKIVEDIINYEVNSQDTAEIERDILNYELELAKGNQNIDIISNSNISVNTIEDKINSTDNTILYDHDNIQILNQSNSDKIPLYKSIIEDQESVEDNKSVTELIEDQESVEDNKSIENQESVEHNKSIENQESVEHNKSITQLIEDQESVEDNTIKKTIQTNTIDKLLKKNKISKENTLTEISENIINPLIRKYSQSQLKILCINNNIPINKGTKKTLITKLLNNNIII